MTMTIPDINYHRIFYLTYENSETEFCLRYHVELALFGAQIAMRSGRRLLVRASVVPSSPILVTLMMEHYVPQKHQFLQEPHGVTPYKTPFFIVTAVKTLGLT
jgi:hypothetical protein